MPVGLCPSSCAAGSGAPRNGRGSNEVNTERKRESKVSGRKTLWCPSPLVFLWSRLSLLTQTEASGADQYQDRRVTAQPTHFLAEMHG